MIRKMFMPVMMGAFLAVTGLVDTAAAAQEELDFSGRVRGFYQTETTKGNSDADSVTDAKFGSDARFGVKGSTTQDGITAYVKLETEVHDGRDGYKVGSGESMRDAYVGLGNDMFTFKMGYHFTFDYYADGYSGYNSVGGGIDNYIGRNPAVSLSVSSIPNLGLDVAYGDWNDGMKDSSGFEGMVTYDLDMDETGITIAAITGSVTTTENEDRGGDEDNTETKGGFGLAVDVSAGMFDPFVTYQSNVTTTGAAGADDVETTSVALGIGADINIDDASGIYVIFQTKTDGTDEKDAMGDDQDDAVKTSYNIGYARDISAATLTASYASSSTTGEDDVDGAEDSSLAVMLAWGF